MPKLFERDTASIKTLKRAGYSAREIHKPLQEKAVFSVKQAVKIFAMSAPTARTALNNLKKLNIVEEVSGSGKEKLFIYTELIQLLDRGAEPI